MALNILLVDDSAVMRRMLLKTLQMTGIPLGAIREAGNGADGLDILKHSRIDLMLLDISMPGMRGDELLARLRTLPNMADLPVIVVSSERSAERVAQIEALGGVFINKPFLPEQLRAVIMNMGALRHELATG